MAKHTNERQATLKKACNFTTIGGTVATTFIFGILVYFEDGMYTLFNQRTGRESVPLEVEPTEDDVNDFYNGIEISQATDLERNLVAV